MVRGSKKSRTSHNGIGGIIMKLRKIKSEIIKSGDYTQFGQRARSCIHFHNNSKDWGTCGKEDEYSRCLCLSDMKCCFNGGQIIKELEK